MTKNYFTYSWGWVDWLKTVYCFLAFVVTLICVCPCSKYHKKYCASSNYDAFKLKTYYNILKKRGYDPTKILSGDNKPLGKRMFQIDINKDKIMYHGEFWRDYVLLIRNEHACFSLCYSHSAHPLKRWKRIVVFIIALQLSFSLSIFTYFVIVAFGVGKAWKQILINQLLSFVLGLYLNAVNSLIVKLSTCPCIYDYHKYCKRVAKFIGSCLVLLTFAYSVFHIVLFFFSVKDDQNYYSNSKKFWELFTWSFFGGLCIDWGIYEMLRLYLDVYYEYKHVKNWYKTNADHEGTYIDTVEENEKNQNKCLKYLKMCCDIWCYCFIYAWFINNLTCGLFFREERILDQNYYAIKYQEYIAYRDGKIILPRDLDEKDLKIKVLRKEITDLVKKSSKNEEEFKESLIYDRFATENDDDLESINSFDLIVNDKN